MAITALRITGPSTRSQWLERRTLPKSGPVHIWWTDEEDLANAYLAALSSNHPGFEAFFIAGDEEQKEINLSKSSLLLGESLSLIINCEQSNCLFSSMSKTTI